MSYDSANDDRQLSLDDVAACVRRIFADSAVPEAQRLEFSEVRTPEIIMPGLMFRFPMTTVLSGERVMVTVFANPGRVGMQFWSQEVRALLRLGGLNHEALPRFLTGAVRRIPRGWNSRVADLAFVITDRAPTSLAEHGRLAEMRKHPVSFVRRLVSLADALSALHNDGLLHRNIQPRTVTLEMHDAASGVFDLRLDGFEMSSFHANLLRRGVEQTDDVLASAILTDFVNQGPQALAAVPLERLTYVFRTDPASVPELASGDVYALGILAFQCLVADLDATLLAQAFPAVDPTHEDQRKWRFDPAGWRRLHDWIKSTTRKMLRPTLRDLLLRMIDAEPAQRLRSGTLVSELYQLLDQIVEELEPSTEVQPYLVAIDPAECVIFQSWGWISEQSLSGAAGQAELFAFLADDLRAASLEHAPGELARNIRDRYVPEMDNAQYVLRGRSGSYYGHLYENRSNRGSGKPIFESVFMIRWAIRRDVGAEDGRRVSRRVRALRLVSHRAEIVRDAGGGNYPSWKPLLNAVELDRKPVTTQQDLMGALRFLLAYQRVAIEARKYPFVRDDVDAPGGGSGGSGRYVLLRYDAARDRTWRSRDAMRNLFTLDTGRRPTFGDFFGSREDRNFDGTVRWWRDVAGGPKRDWDATGVGEVERVEPDRVWIRVFDDADVPAIGWLEPADDAGQESAFEREAEAVANLADRPALLASLLTPRSLMRSEEAWTDAGGEFETKPSLPVKSKRRHFSALIGDRSKNALGRMLSADPIFVLQGPPGTGKTTIAARAVRAAVRSDPSIRILVSAQSHYALDNLALGILEMLPEEPETIAIRLVSDNTERRKVDDQVQPLTRRRLIQERPGQVAAKVTGYLKDNKLLQPELQDVLQRWIQAIPSSKKDIIDRTRRGANVVFSTCLHAAETGPVLPDRPPSFDWVIVEEAAKALPTEIAIPLVRGSRWTLIGDHRQLSAYNLREIANFLTLCMQQPPDQGLAPLLHNAANFPAYFEIFSRFFTERKTEARTVAGVSGYDDRPVDALDLQFRMTEPIGDVVRAAFYPDALATGPRHERTVSAAIPTGFKDKRLIWLDTGDDEIMSSTGQSCAGEVFVIRRLLEKLWGASVPSPGELAILSPYRKQVDLLTSKLESRFAGLVHTVDSFQGREADIVIVTLVRGYARRPYRDVYDRIGHLADASRVNVLMSRAREYLMVVGQMNHFHDSGRMVGAEGPGAFWATICHQFRTTGRVLSTVDLFGGYAGDGT